MLEEKLEQEELTRNEAPKAVWESEAIFRNHKLNNFRGMYQCFYKSLALWGSNFFFLFREYFHLKFLSNSSSFIRRCFSRLEIAEE